MNTRKATESLPDYLQTGKGSSYPNWLNQAVFYQIYPQSFHDSNGDGIGDIPGIIQKLDYLQWLGVNAVWINPCFVSPFQDAGFSTAEENNFYLRLDPHKNRPSVERQVGDSASLLNHVRKLIDLRKKSRVLQADGLLIPLQVENDHRYFTYLRQADDERFLIILNPSVEPSRVRLQEIHPVNITPEICHGLEIHVEKDYLEVQMTGVSYGVFRL